MNGLLYSYRLIHQRLALSAKGFVVMNDPHSPLGRNEPPAGDELSSERSRLKPKTFRASLIAMCIMAFLFITSLGFILFLGALGAIFLPEWTDIPVRILLVALAFWLMGELYDIAFGKT